MPTNTNPELSMIRHAVATMVYRAAKTLRGVPTDFAQFRIRPDSRTPVEIVAHMGDLFDWSLSMAKGEEKWRSSLPEEWSREVARFYACVGKFDAYLAGSAVICCSAEKLFQGPIADAISHVGQLAMLRNMFGTPITGENYFRADIHAGQVGPDQPRPVKEF